MAQDASLEPFDVPSADRPRHIAIIMDGNGRWAQRQGLPRAEGHRRGAASVRVITEECSRLGLEQLTLYCLSSENWKRPESELAILMHLLEQFMIEERGLIMRENIRVDMIGGREEIPESARRELQKTIDMSAGNKGLRLCLAINYGGRGELVDVARRIAREVAEGKLRPEQITEETISSRLHTAGMRDPDLLVRTAGELRVSNFLLWQISYAEMWVTQRCWPEFGVADLRQAMRDYAARERRFGGL